MKGKTKQQKGITLIALIITIVVLLILAAVAINSIQNDGILGHAQNVAGTYNQAVSNEQGALQGYLNYLNPNNGETGPSSYEEVTLQVATSDAMLTRTKNSQTKDIHGNVVKIPAGFKIVVDSEVATMSTEIVPSVGYTVENVAVEKGIVITDGTNEFVWVPVGEIKTESETKNIQLARYEFDFLDLDETGSVTGFGTGAITGLHTAPDDKLVDDYTSGFLTGRGEELTPCVDYGFVEEIDGMSCALNIRDFYNKALTGYYIGRYEARKNGTTLRCNSTDKVYLVDTQPEAINLSQNMYTNKPFITDLVNSFAWDTAIAFIQCFEDEDYSVKMSVNSHLLETGTVGTENEDKVCNIYDMASNYDEYSTEVVFKSEQIESVWIHGGEAVFRGGNTGEEASYYDNASPFAGTRSYRQQDGGLRTILYL